MTNPVSSPKAAAKNVLININGTASFIAPLLPPLKPNQPNQSINVPSTANGKLDDFEIEASKKNALKGDVYLAKITRVEPSLQAAFVNYGKKRHGFLAFNDIQTEYYQIPHDDKERLIKEEEKLREEIKEESKKLSVYLR